MVYLLHRYFGRDGREEAESLLERRSGDVDNPRILGAFNEPTPDWLAFFMFTFFTDRDGKYQLSSLAESGFDPLARTCRFMLTEEAHHMFVGETGVSRIVQRTAEVMAEQKVDDPGSVRVVRRHRPADHAAVSEFPLQRDARSVRIGHFVERGELLHQRPEGALRRDEGEGRSRASARPPTTSTRSPADRSSPKAVPALTALNERLRDDYIREVMSGVERWNRIIAKTGVTFRLLAAAQGFHREIGNFAGHHITPDGRVVTETEWNAHAHEWLPSPSDHAFVQSLMTGRVVEPGRFANWIAPPRAGINNQPLNFDACGSTDRDSGFGIRGFDRSGSNHRIIESQVPSPQCPTFLRQRLEIDAAPVRRLLRRHRRVRCQQAARDDMVGGAVDRIDRNQPRLLEVVHREFVRVGIAAGDGFVVAVRQAGHLQSHLVLIGPEPRHGVIAGALAGDGRGDGTRLIGRAFCTDSRRVRPPQNGFGCSAQSPMAKMAVSLVCR